MDKKIRFMVGTTCHLGNEFKDFFLFRNHWSKHLYNAYKIARNCTSVWAMKEVIKEIVEEAH